MGDDFEHVAKLYTTGGRWFIIAEILSRRSSSMTIPLSLLPVILVGGCRMWAIRASVSKFERMSSN
jgi:hypothetical protein